MRKQGEPDKQWDFPINSLSLEDFLRKISEKAFSPGSTPQDHSNEWSQ
jgi:hypothetical protein